MHSGVYIDRDISTLLLSSELNTKYMSADVTSDMDKEAGRKVLPLFDRETNNISKSTVGFVNFVVLPLYTKLNLLLHKLAQGHPELNADALAPVLTQLASNVEIHKKRSAVEISNGQQ